MPTFYNQGLMVVSPGAGNTAEITSWNYPSPISPPFNSTGFVQVQSGIFDIYQGGSSSNASGFAVAAGATLLFTGADANPFTFTGGTYQVAGMTQIGDATHGGRLIFAAGTTVNAGNSWEISDNGYVDLSAATIGATFTSLQTSGRLFLGANSVTIAGLTASNGFVVTGTGTVTLIGQGSIVDTVHDGAVYNTGRFNQIEG
jgi:hypothetical protein